MAETEYFHFTSRPEQWNKLKPLVKAMRHEPTLAENALWQRLRKRQINGVRFRRQHAIQGFIVDFVCLSQLLIIEVDGSIHELPEHQVADAARQAILEAEGFRFLRFTNEQVLQSIDAVLEVIWETMVEEDGSEGV